MEGDCVWATDWLPQTAKYIQGIGYDDPVPSKPLRDGINFGRPIHPSPPPLFAYLDEKERQRKRGDFVMISGRLTLVTPRFADLLRQFDLGPSPDQGPGIRRVDLFPMPLFAGDQRSHIADYFMMHVSVQKDTLVPEHSPGARKLMPESLFFSLGHLIKDDDLTMTEAALEGPDMWREETIMNGIFVSDRLKRAMEAAKIKPVKFLRCPVV